MNNFVEVKLSFSIWCKMQQANILFNQFLWLWPSFDKFDRYVTISFWNCVWWWKRLKYRNKGLQDTILLKSKPTLLQSKFTYTKDMRCGTNLFVGDTFVCSRVCRKFWWLYSICIDKMLVVEYHSLLQGKKKIKRKAYSKWIFK